MCAAHRVDCRSCGFLSACNARYVECVHTWHCSTAGCAEGYKLRGPVLPAAELAQAVTQVETTAFVIHNGVGRPVYPRALFDPVLPVGQPPGPATDAIHAEAELVGFLPCGQFKHEQLLRWCGRFQGDAGDAPTVPQGAVECANMLGDRCQTENGHTSAEAARA